MLDGTSTINKLSNDLDVDLFSKYLSIASIASIILSELNDDINFISI